jgi:VIT1/CCC1 family predicted Fe2+/Mn2+ transporter
MRDLFDDMSPSTKMLYFSLVPVFFGTWVFAGLGVSFFATAIALFVLSLVRSVAENVDI